MLFIHNLLFLFLLLGTMSSATSLSSKRIAVVGGGSVGTTLAQALASSDHSSNVVIAARDPEKTKTNIAQDSTLKDLSVDSVSSAVSSADILILATPSAHSDEAIQEIATSLGNVDGKIIIDATNPLSEFSSNLEIRWAQGTSGGEVLQKCLPNAKVYKAFNTLGVEHMKDAKGKDLLYCGPDEDIASVIKAVGFQPYYVGPLRYARNLEAMAELWIHCAIPPLPGNYLGRDWTFGVSGNVAK